MMCATKCLFQNNLLFDEFLGGEYVSKGEKRLSRRWGHQKQKKKTFLDD